MEIWKDVLGYEGLYIISDQGNIISKAKDWIGGSGAKRHHDDMPLKPTINKKGYLRIGLSKDGKDKEYSVHRLVLEAFIGKSELQGNHINGKKSDNRLENLEYVTGKENVRHAIINGLYENSFKAARNSIEKQKIKVYGKNIITGYITEIFDSITAASKSFLNGSEGNIWMCLNGKRKSAYGYIWKRVTQN